MVRPGRFMPKSAWLCVATLLFLCVCVLAASGCAAGMPAPQGGVMPSSDDTADGWRLGVIVRLGDALPDPGTLEDDCRIALVPSVRAAGAFAEVAYRQGRRSRLRIVLLDRDRAWAVGDEASIDLRDCRQAAVPPSTPLSKAPTKAPATAPASGSIPSPRSPSPSTTTS